MKRVDPSVEAPVDGAPNRTAIEGKQEDFYYLLARKDELGKLLTKNKEAGVKVAPFVRCRTDEDNGEEFVGYGAIRDGLPVSDFVEVGEHALVKRPLGEQQKVWDAHESVNALYDKRIHGEVAASGAPVKVSVSEEIIRE